MNIKKKIERLSEAAQLFNAARKGQRIEIQEDGSYVIVINRYV